MYWRACASYAFPIQWPRIGGLASACSSPALADRSNPIKRLLLPLSLIALFALVSPGFVLIAVLIGCSAGAYVPAGCANAPSLLNNAVGLAWLFFIVGCLLTLTVMIIALLRTAQIARWGWFALILFSGPFGAAIYGWLGPDYPRQTRTTPPSPTSVVATNSLSDEATLPTDEARHLASDVALSANDTGFPLAQVGAPPAEMDDLANHPGPPQS